MFTSAYHYNINRHTLKCPHENCNCLNSGEKGDVTKKALWQAVLRAEKSPGDRVCQEADLLTPATETQTTITQGVEESLERVQAS